MQSRSKDCRCPWCVTAVLLFFLAAGAGFAGVGCDGIGSATFAEWMDRDGDARMNLRAAFTHGADPNEKISIPSSAYESMLRVDRLLTETVPNRYLFPLLKSKNKMFITPLSLALQFEDTELAEKLLDAGADPNLVASFYLIPPLMKAIELQDPHLVEAMLRHGADPNQKNFIGTSLNCAAVSWIGKKKRLRPLMQADSLASREDLEQAVSRIMANPNPFFFPNEELAIKINCRIIRLLIDAGATTDGRDMQNGLDPIVTAVLRRNFYGAELMLDACSNPEELAYTQEGVRYPLITLVAESGHYGLLKKLLDRGISPYTQSSDGIPLYNHTQDADLQALIRRYM